MFIVKLEISNKLYNVSNVQKFDNPIKFVVSFVLCFLVVSNFSLLVFI